MRRAGLRTVAAADIAYSPFHAGTPNTATDLEDYLDQQQTLIGTASVAWSEPTIELAAPLSGSTLELSRPVLCTVPLGGAPIGLTAGRDLEVTHPGSIDALGSLKVLVTGSVPAAPLVHGEVLASSVALFNTDPTGTDLEVSSPLGRFVAIEKVTLLGNAAKVVNAAGACALDALILAPAAPGSGGLVIDGTIGSMFYLTSSSFAPGVAPYTAFTVADTATISGQLSTANWSFDSALPTDAAYNIGTSASLPGGAPFPTSTVGVRIFGGIVAGPGGGFAAGSRDQSSPELSVSENLSMASSRYIGDAFVDVGANPNILVPTSSVAAGVRVIVPITNATNGGAGPTLSVVALLAVSERFTIVVASTGVAWTTSDSATDYALRYDAGPDELTARANFVADIVKSGPGNTITVELESRPKGGGAWGPIAAGAPLLTTTAPRVTAAAAELRMSAGDEFRLVASSSEGTSDFEIERLELTPRGQA